MGILQYDPSDLADLEAVNLRFSATNSEWFSPLLEADRKFLYLWNVDVEGDGTNGDFELAIEILNNDRTTVLFEKVFAENISSAAGGGGKISHQVLWGGGVDGLIESPSAVAVDNLQILKVMRFFRLRLKVTTQVTNGESEAISTLIVQERDR